MADDEAAGAARAEAERHFQLGYEAQMQGRLEEAVAHYQRSIGLHPTAEAYTFLGWAYSFQGRPNDAIAQCKIAISVDPDFGNPYNDLGAYLLELQVPALAGDAVPSRPLLYAAMELAG